MAEDQDLDVETLQVSVVKPATPTSAQSLYLSALDILWVPLRNSRRLLFCKTDHPFASISESLKSSLSTVLVDFYPVAGRLLLNQESQRPEIQCNDGGVEFIEATVGFSIEDLQKQEFTHHHWFDKLVPRFKDLTTCASHPEAPLLSVQVTGFSDGFCVGMAFHHVLGDGKSYWHFMNSWSQLCKGLATISAQPHHDRALLTDRLDPDHPKIHYRWVPLSNNGPQSSAHILKFVTEREHSMILPESKAGTDITKFYARTAHRQLDKATFHFSDEAIRNLKIKSGAVSSFVAVSAHMWRCIVKSRGFEGEAPVFFAVLADFRAKVDPALPEQYFGNCVVPCVVRTTAEELMREEGMASAGGLIQDAIDAMAKDEQQLWRMVRWVEYEPNTTTIRMLGNYAKCAGGVNVIGSPRFPCYDVDFGWGRPLAADVAAMNEAGSILVAPARIGGNGIDVTTALPAEHMHILRQEISCDV